MAIDTADKRSSVIMVSLPWRGRLPLPDGAVTQDDRQHVGLQYSGIEADEATPAASTFPAIPLMYRRRGRR